MSSLNKVQLIGRLGSDPEFRTTNGGKSVVLLSLATSEKRGEEQWTEWHRIVVWEKLADLAQTYLKKGSQVYVEGKISTRKFTDKTQTEKRITEIVAQNLQFLDPIEKRQSTPTTHSATQPTRQPATTQSATLSAQFMSFADDDIPF